MATKLNPYLNFRTQTREAMTFYQSVFGGELTLTSFTEFGMQVAPDEAENIMHSQLSGGAVEFMAADVPSAMDLRPGSSVTMSLFGDDHAELSGYYAKLAAGGSEVMPLEAAPWGDTFGMCTDRFGISWMVNITQATP